jgi:hypothetical protein
MFKGVDGVTRVEHDLKSFEQVRAMLAEMDDAGFDDVRGDVLTREHVWRLVEADTIQFYIGTEEGEGILLRTEGKDLLAAVLTEAVSRMKALRQEMRDLAEAAPEKMAELPQMRLFGFGYALGEMEGLSSPDDPFNLALASVRREIARRGLIDEFAASVVHMHQRGL